MNNQKFYISLCRHQFFVKMAGLMLILSYSGNALQLRAQEQDTAIAKDTVRQDSIHNRDAEENTYTPLERFLPPSPQAAALARYGEYPVSLATGVPEISIPLYEIKLGDYTLPISISYHASGIKVDDVASTVGLGWVLNAGGAVSRTVVGAPDLRENRNETQDTLYRSYDRYHDIYYSSGNGEQYSGIIMPILTDALNSTYDTASDRYSYNFGGKAGVFRYNYRDKKFVTLNHQPVLIFYNDRNSDNGYFSILDSDGTEYVFKDRERTIMSGSDYMCPTTWYITDINTPYGNIHFNYRTADAYTMSTFSETTSVGMFHYYNSDEHYVEDRYGADNQSGRFDYTYSTKLLTEICWNGNMVQFTYSSDRNDIAPERLTGIIVKGCDGTNYKTITLDNNSYLGDSIQNNRMMLNSIAISDEGTYLFNYNRERKFPDYGCVAYRDYWGYYNGKNSSHAITNEAMTAALRQFPEFLGPNATCTTYADKSPDFNYVQAGILTRVTFPTGGYTDFTYAQNYSGGAKGGLRVSKISDYDLSGEKKQERTYSYSGFITQDPPNSALFYDTYHGFRDMAITTVYENHATCSSDPLVPLVDGNGISVFYDYVTETQLNGDQTQYQYLYGGILPAGNNYQQFPWPQFSSPNLNDEGACDPLLIYKSDGIRTETYDYSIVRLDTLEIGVKTMNITTVSSVMGSPAILQMADIRHSPTPLARINGYVKTYRLNSKTITDSQQGISTTEFYTYDPQYRTLCPKTITTTNSDGKEFKTVNEYPFECTSSVCTGMYEQNMADQVVASRHYVDNTFIKMDSTLFVNQNGSWYYPYKQFEQRAGGSLYETLQLTDYDSNGNPRTIIENGTDKTALVWGFKSSWPVAKVSGLTYNNLTGLGLTNTLNTIAQDSLPNNMVNHLETLRSGIGSNGLVTTFNYKPLFGVSAITTENGYTTYYDYGTDGKLSAIRDNNGPLQQFCYQYVNPYSGSSNSTNYVQTIDMLSSTTGNITRQYYDGLGRPVQTAKEGMNTLGMYVFTQQEYDQKGRVNKDWLPTAVNSSDYLTNISQPSGTMYNDSYAFSTISYDALDRPTFTQTPGNAWHSASKGISKEYISNAASNVKRYQASLTANSLIKNGTYAEKMLYGEKTTDEDGKSVTVFTDKRGRKVLERQGTSNNTYYIYDDLDQLRFVLSPQYQEAGYKDVYGYEYRYDEKGRMTKKFLPQCEFTQYWYDTAGRMKFMQDATLRSKSPSLYRFYLYDKFGRLCIQGTCTSCWRGETVNVATYVGTGGGFNGTGYSVSRPTDINSLGLVIEQVNYYDNYDFVSDLYSNYSLSQTPLVTTTGLLTGTRQTASDGTMLLNANYYDFKGRVTDVRSTTLNDKRQLLHNSYNYWGGITQTLRYLNSPSGTQELYTSLNNGYFTNTNLLKTVSQSIKIGTGSTYSETIHELTYDSIGHVKTDKRGNSIYNTMTYHYDVHGWLKGLCTTAFQEWLYYADAPNGATSCYNGNISVQKWKQSNESLNRGYKFTYDGLNRLIEAVYGESNFSDNHNDYNEKVLEYSANGMMKRFQRRGLKSDGEYGKTDNLHIKLDGNRPLKITDDADLQTVYGTMEFKDGADLTTEYGYDDYGSLIYDANKGIAKIDYDNLNYPRRVQFTNGNTIEYVYTPDGRKLRAKYQTATGNVVVPLNTAQTITASSTTQTDYVGDLIYTGTASGSSVTPSLSKILYPDGYFMTTSTTGGVFRYFVKDHLGNNRVVNNGNTVYQRTHYYPFGGPYADVGTASDYQPYKYNGKELDRMHGLDLYDYGARQYDPVVPMFTQQDPLAEKYYHLSPYVYCGNNPVNAIDPDGMEKLDVLDPEDEKNEKIKQAIANFNDEKNVINIWAHGSSNGMTVFDNNKGEETTITDAKGFKDFLNNNSKVWKNRKDGEQVTIVLHSCRTGDKDNGMPGFAQRVSSSIENAVIIAPEQNVYTASGIEKGTFFNTVESTRNFHGAESRWIQFESGKRTNTYRGNSLPGAAGYHYVTNQSPWYVKVLNFFGL